MKGLILPQGRENRSCCDCDRTTVETHPDVQSAAARLREAYLAYALLAELTDQHVAAIIKVNSDDGTSAEMGKGRGKGRLVAEGVTPFAPGRISGEHGIRPHLCQSPPGLALASVCLLFYLLFVAAPS